MEPHGTHLSSITSSRPIVSGDITEAVKRGNIANVKELNGQLAAGHEIDPDILALEVRRAVWTNL